jgi:hypothetical protein
MHEYVYICTYTRMYEYVCIITRTYIYMVYVGAYITYPVLRNDRCQYLPNDLLDRF